ncbi:hypothetical protein VPNG_06398 [Cytospora leucostoma]|uniref:Uncharacterized protein n=1 Tax=Cytospora leucostoma TaxID=1230097 RepID=A0A423WYS0_9PEZI|nr:hypothetical protein VPNG_06398 [Cytospora leucostoma]
MSDISTPALPLLGKNAIVTGASRGIGTGIAWKLASDGANWLSVVPQVILGYTSPGSAPKVKELQGRIEALPHKPKSHAVQADLGQLEGPKNFLDELHKWSSGDLKIHILVNNAATLTMRNLSEVTLEDYEYMYNVNVRGTLFFTQAILPYLQPKGRIINLSSIGARDTIKGGSLYTSSKAAIECLTRTWAAELGGNGTTVNAVSPGPVLSDMLDKVPEELKQLQKSLTHVENRYGTVGEIANVVGLVASPAASWISGQCINASGGLQTI